MKNYKTDFFFFHPLGCVPSYPAKTKTKIKEKKNHKKP